MFQNMKHKMRALNPYAESETYLRPDVHNAILFEDPHPLIPNSEWLNGDGVQILEGVTGSGIINMLFHKSPIALLLQGRF
jgi:hypothetical protein